MGDYLQVADGYPFVLLFLKCLFGYFPPDNRHINFAGIICLLRCENRKF